jgi:ParB/Sulfiredoxin domain
MKTPYEIKRMNLSKLKSHPKQSEVRFISDEAKAGLAGSMEEFGMLEEIIVNKRTGHIVSGHQRCQIMLESGRKSASVKVIDVDEKTEDAIFLTLNNHAICGEFKPEAKILLEALKVEIGDLHEITGLNLLESVLPVKLVTDFNSKEFQKFDESAKDDVKMITCPHCGEEFAV